MAGEGATDPRRGRDSCQSLIVGGRQAGDRRNIRSGAGAWPRETYEAHVARLIGAPAASRYARTSSVVHQSVGSSRAVPDITESVPVTVSSH